MNSPVWYWKGSVNGTHDRPFILNRIDLKRRVPHSPRCRAMGVFDSTSPGAHRAGRGCLRCQLLFTYVPIEAFVADWMAPAMSLTKVILPIRRPTLTRYQPTWPVLPVPRISAAAIYTGGTWSCSQSSSSVLHCQSFSNCSPIIRLAIAALRC